MKKVTDLFMWNKNAIKIGSYDFGSKVYSSSDFNIMHLVLQDKGIRDIILFILKDPYIYGVFIQDNYIQLHTQKIFGKDKHKIIQQTENKYTTLISTLNKKLIELMPPDNNEDRRFVKKYS